MYITSDPKDKVYKDLLDLAFSECEQFILVVRQNARQGDIPSETMNNVLKGLSTFLIEKKNNTNGRGQDYGQEGIALDGNKSRP